MYKPRLLGRNPDLTQSAYDEITLGENPCTLVKHIYYPDVHWTKCDKECANKFTALKRMMRLQLPNDSELGILKWINSMSSEDIREYLDGNLQAMEAKVIAT